MAEQAAAPLAPRRADESAAADRAAADRAEAVEEALERVLAESHAQATELQVMVDRVAAGRAAAANMQAQRAAEAAEEQAMVEQEFADALPFVAEALGYFLVVLAAALVPTVLFQYDLCLLSDYDLLSDAKRLCGVG